MNSHSANGTRFPRSGAITLELIMVLPIWIVLLLAAIEFGQLLSNLQQLTLASRLGASEASETDLTGTTNADPVPSNIVVRIEKQLLTSRLVDPNGVSLCRVILEHNVEGVYTRMESAGASCDCEPPGLDLLPATVPATPYVRITVCVPYDAVAPNVLKTCGIDFTGRLVQQSTTFRYELGEAFP